MGWLQRLAQGNIREGNLGSRIYGVLIIVGLVFLGYVARLVYLTVIVADDYSAQAKEARTISYEITPRRGTIYDRNGNILACSIDATTIYANPQEITSAATVAAGLASVLGGEASDYLEELTEDTTFVYIQRQCDVDVAQQVEDLGLEGIYFLDDTKRVYPYGSIAGQIVGVVNVDGEGIAGLEMQYDDILSGTPGRMVTEVGRNGMEIPGGTEVEIPVKDGQDIIISIDINLQEQVENLLSKAVKDRSGSDGNAIVMDAETGEIYAIASTPYFNPSDLSTVAEGSTTLKGITSAFEPGSVFKSVSALALLESGQVTTDTSIYAPTSIAADEYTVSDAHDRDGQDMTMREIITVSSNVGISLMVEKYLGFKPLYDAILRYGMNDVTGVDYPGESSGYLTDQSTWSAIQSYNVTFGQGVMVTPLQVTRFYALIRNGGYLVTPHFAISYPQTGEDITYDKTQVVTDEKALDSMKSMLRSVVTDGTGTLAAIDGLDVCGKTGTAEYANDSGSYVEDAYNLDFVGFIDNSNSSLVCYTNVNHVYGENNVTQVFNDIMDYCVSHYKIAAVEEDSSEDADAATADADGDSGDSSESDEE